MKLRSTDPLEQIIEAALVTIGARYVLEGEPGNLLNIDFYLPDSDLYIEVKQFYTERALKSLSKAPNMIFVQGKEATEKMAQMIIHGLLT